MRVRPLRKIASELCAGILPAAQALQKEAGYLPAENIIRLIGGRVISLANAFGLPAEVDVAPFIDKPLGWSSSS